MFSGGSKKLGGTGDIVSNSVSANVGPNATLIQNVTYDDLVSTA